MKRMKIKARPNWDKIVESQGLTYHTASKKHLYWQESAAYEFTLRQVEEIERATNDISQICLDAVQYVIDKNRFEELKIPQAFVPYILKTWDEEHPSIYGRLDLGYCGDGPPKLLEYNADTPTMLLESSVVQWYWMKDKFRELDPNFDSFLIILTENII